MNGHETRQNRWPPPHTYAMAVAGRALLRGELAEFEPRMQQDQPMMPVFAAGGNAVVFCGTLEGVRKGARFFTADPGHAEDRYRAIHEHLESVDLGAIAGFEWLDAVIEMGTITRPCVLMDWIEGSTLDRAITDRIGHADRMEALVDGWVTLGNDLRRANVAHGDLQHGNVMIDTTGALRLVDLDGMWIPALESSPTDEIGHPNYQHPGRSEREAGEAPWGPDLDAFSWLVIYVSLAALATEPSLWKTHHTGTNLVLSQQSFTNPATAEVWNDLDAIGGRIRQAVDLLRASLEQRPTHLTLAAALETVGVTGRDPRVGPVPSPVSTPKPPPEPAPSIFPWWEGDDAPDWKLDWQADEQPVPARSPVPSEAAEEFKADTRSEPDDPSDLQPDWSKPDTSWLESDERDDQDWVQAVSTPGGRLAHPGVEQSQRTTKLVMLALVVVGIVIALFRPAVGLPLIVGVVLIGIGRIRSQGEALRTSPIVWKDDEVSIGAAWRARYADLEVQRSPNGDLRFSARGAPVIVDWLSDVQREQLLSQLGRRGVKIGGSGR